MRLVAGALLLQRYHVSGPWNHADSWLCNPLHTIKFISIRGGFHILLHKTFLEQVHSACLSCTADTRPLNEFEKGPNLAENREEYVLLTTWEISSTGPAT